MASTHTYKCCLCIHIYRWQVYLIGMRLTFVPPTLVNLEVRTWCVAFLHKLWCLQWYIRRFSFQNSFPHVLFNLRNPLPSVASTPLLPPLLSPALTMCCSSSLITFEWPYLVDHCLAFLNVFEWHLIWIYLIYQLFVPGAEMERGFSVPVADSDGSALFQEKAHHLK